MMFNEDLDAFLQTAEHADQIIIQRSGRIIDGIVDREYVESNEISGYRPVITCKTSDMKYLVRGDILEIGDTLYKYIYQEKDGTGFTQIVLEVVSG